MANSLERIRTLLLGIFLIMTPVGIVLMLSGVPAKAYLWTTSIYLGVEAVLTLTLLLKASTPLRAMAATALLILVSIVIEFTGVTTGYPFGSYYYSYYLSPFIVGNVPLAISFAWFVIVVNAFLLIRTQLPKISTLRSALFTGGLVLSIDILLEPFAAFINSYWRWTNNLIPFRNYASWFLLGVFFSLLIDRILVTVREDEKSAALRFSGILLGVNIGQFVLINLVHGYVLQTLAGSLLLAVTLWMVQRRRAHAL